MKPTVESWNVNPLEVGPIYPLAGWETAMVVACAAFCTVFMIWKFRSESTKYIKQARKLREPDALRRALAAGSRYDDEQHEV